MLRLPSVKTLVDSKLVDSPEQARTLRRMMRHPSKGLPPATQKWAESCYNPPEIQELRMRIADELTEGHGVEYCRARNGSGFSYVNQGDTYNSTIVRTGKGNYRVACWGDVVEAWERRGIRFD